MKHTLEYNENHELVTCDPALASIFDEVKSILAPSDVPVLILGDTGSGKEGIASALHFHSSRKLKPFLAINCSAISESIAESELFGHEKGAFSGAGKRKEGFFESVSGGTLFFDEIGELSLGMQAKLLRVLEEGQIIRVGGTTAIDVDVRIVAATNRDLQKMVDEGTFRKDLYYRLAIDIVRIPSLQERPGDITLLAKQFADEKSGVSGQTPFRLDADLQSFLQSQSWPGNVRELKGVVRSIVGRHRARNAESKILETVDLPLQYRPKEAASRSRINTTASTRTGRPGGNQALDFKVLALVRNEGICTVPEIAKRLDQPVDTVRRSVKRLQKDGAVIMNSRRGSAGAEVKATIREPYQ